MRPAADGRRRPRLPQRQAYRSHELPLREVLAIRGSQMSNTPRFARKSMVVTGAAQGIGKQVAIDAAGEGARVTLVDRSPLVEAVAVEIVASGGQAVSFVADLETWDGNVETMRAAHKAHGAIDILVTNVGGAIWMKPFQHFDEKQIAAEVQ